MILASIVIPARDAEGLIGRCLAALERQSVPRARYEVIVVDDGSADGTAEVARSFPGVRVLHQTGRGPAAARTRGARAGRGEIVVFTDADCEPTRGWLAALLAPFEDPTVVGTKGTYLTRQRALTARFTQLEYEDKYDRMRRFESIDFIDTYAAAFRRTAFLEAGGYDESFPVPSAEDVDLSYRLAAAGHRMLFAPAAAVYHRHPERPGVYLRRKYRYAHWRVKAVAKTPAKAISDSHSPLANKAQVALMGPLAALLALRAVWAPAGPPLAGRDRRARRAEPAVRAEGRAPRPVRRGGGAAHAPGPQRLPGRGDRHGRPEGARRGPLPRGPAAGLSAREGRLC